MGNRRITNPCKQARGLQIRVIKDTRITNPREQARVIDIAKPGAKVVQAE